MSMKHPIIVVTGSSGAGTTTVKHTFEGIFWREKVNGNHRRRQLSPLHPRRDPRTDHRRRESKGRGISHFGPEANLLEELEQLFRTYGESRRRQAPLLSAPRRGEAARRGLRRVATSPLGRPPPDTDCLFYEGLHGAVITDKVNICRHADLLIGVVPHHQPGMDTKDPPGHQDPRLFPGGGAGNHPAAACTTTCITSSRSSPHPHQLPAGAHGGHLQPLHRPGHPHRRRIHGDHPLPRPRGRPPPTCA